MKKFLLIAMFGLIGLVGCVPEAEQVINAAPAGAGAFARLKFAAPPEKVFPALRDSIEAGVGDTLIVNVFAGRDGVGAFWQKIAGQSARVYFTITTDGENSLVKVSTVPARAPEAQLLARSLDVIGQNVAERLGLKTYTFEPDR
jgi:hypothetical protein